MHFAKSVVIALAVTCVSAIPIRDADNIDAIEHEIDPRDVAAVSVTDPDDWRYFHKEGLRQGNDHWWRGGGSRVYEMKAAHEQVVTPSLPKEPKVPKPFLPTDDPKVLALYTLAIEQYKAEEAKGMTEQMEDLVQKKKDMATFNRMNECVHDKSFCKQLKFRDAPATSPYYKKYKKEYTQLFEKLKQETQVAGLVELGKQLTQFMTETGQQM